MPPVAVLRDANGKLIADAREGRHLEAARHRLEAADADHGEGARRQDRPLRPDVHADESRLRRRSIRSSTTSIRARRPAASAAARFSPARGDKQALAELGFVVVEIDGMGTPWRSKKFHEAYYGNMGDNTLPDQVAGMKQLAQQLSVHRHRPRGHLGPLGRRLRDRGGDVPLSRTSSRSASPSRATTTTASTRTTGREKWIRGCSRRTRTAPTTTTTRRTRRIAKNLKGKLLLAHGTMDNNVPPNNTLLVVDALIKANKDFDLLMLPNQAHGYGSDGELHDAPALGLLRPLPAGRGAAEGVSAAGYRSLTRPEPAARRS